MIRFLISITLLCLNLTVIAQVKPIYFNGSQVVRDSTKATSYGVFGKLGNSEVWILKRYSLYDELLNTGTFKDAELTIEHGDFVFYSSIEDFNNENLTQFSLKDKYRFVSQRGKFDNGKETGEWIWYYPSGRVMTVLTYEKGIKNGPFLNYDRTGNVVQSGNYLNGEKDGEWLYNRGKDKEFYLKGIPQEQGRSKEHQSTGTVN